MDAVGEVSVSNFPASVPQFQLFTLLDAVDVPLGGEIIEGLPYVNVEGFTKYKLFGKRSGDIELSTEVIFRIWESVDGIQDYGVVEALQLVNSSEDHFGVVVLDFAPYRFIKADVFSTASVKPQSVSLFLYAVR